MSLNWLSKLSSFSVCAKNKTSRGIRSRGSRQDFSNRIDLEFCRLEVRQLLAAYLFVDFGDNFPGGTLVTTQGGLRDVAGDPNPDNRVLGPEVPGATPGSSEPSSFNAGTPLHIISRSFTASDRAEMMALVRRAYRPLDVTVVELTSSPQTTADGRVVAAASTISDITNTVRGGNSASRDCYVLVGTFVVDPGGPLEFVHDAGGLSPGDGDTGVNQGAFTDLSSASNVHDDVGVAYVSSTTDLGFAALEIAHEAGHCFGLMHAVTNRSMNEEIRLFHRAELMSYVSSETAFFFSRYPMIKGDTNTPEGADLPLNYDALSARRGQVTMYDQLRVDPRVGVNPAYNFISGTGAHDVISLTRNGAMIDVSIRAFSDNDRTSAIRVPGELDSVFSYSLAADRPILLYAGDSNDEIVVTGDLGVDLEIDGMLGSDTLIVNGLGLPQVSYFPSQTAILGIDREISYRGIVTYGGRTILFENFDPDSSVTLHDFTAVNFTTPGGADQLELASPQAGVAKVAGNTTASGETTSTILVPLRFFNVFEFSLDTGFGDVAGDSDRVTVDGVSAAGLNRINVRSGLGFDGLEIQELVPLPGQFWFDGEEEGDSVIGPDLVNDWFIGGANSGTLTSSGLNFENTENLGGNANVDRFEFGPLGSLLGLIDGNEGLDALNLSALGQTKTTLTGLGSGDGANGFNGQCVSSMPLLNGFIDIDGAIGSTSSLFDELKGFDSAAQWFYTSATGSYVTQGRTFQYQQMEVLTGGTKIDRFLVKPLTTSSLHINGNLPAVLPGDLLRLNLVGVSGLQLFINSPGNGVFTFNGPHQPIIYSSIERLDVFDYGDAPNTFGTVGPAGARHRVGSNLKMGTYLDPEANGQASILADKDDITGPINDEDGVTFPPTLVSDFRAAARVNASAAAKLDAWIDFNANGIFEAKEQIAASYPIVAGDNRVEFLVPADAASGKQVARFRLSTAGGLSPTGLADDGEVEDHLVQITALASGTAVVMNDPLQPGVSVPMLFAAGTLGNDILRVEPLSSDRVKVVLNGQLIYGPDVQAPFARVGLLGRDGNDQLLLDNDLPLTAELSGGLGNDLLMSALLDDFIRGGDGDDTIYGYNGKDIIYGDSGADTLYGMGGADIMLGGNGDDRVYGGAGRDFLVGGGGNDRLFGESGDDLLIGGTTTYDSTWYKLQKLHSEWFSSRNYADRASNLRAGTGSILSGTGLKLMPGFSVLDDADPDELFGGSDQDWFFQLALDDQLKDQVAGEYVN